MLDDCSTSGRATIHLNIGLQNDTIMTDEWTMIGFGSEERKTMLEQIIQKKVSKLPADRQQQVLEFVEFLESKTATQPRRKRRNIIGLLSDFSTDITEKEINEMRREMWGNFPRDIEL